MFVFDFMPGVPMIVLVAIMPARRDVFCSIEFTSRGSAFVFSFSRLWALALLLLKSRLGAPVIVFLEITPRRDVHKQHTH